MKELFTANEEAVDNAIRKAVQHALMAHKRAGNPIASWKDGRVVMIPAEHIFTERATGGKRK